MYSYKIYDKRNDNQRRNYEVKKIITKKKIRRREDFRTCCGSFIRCGCKVLINFVRNINAGKRKISFCIVMR